MKKLDWRTFTDTQNNKTETEKECEKQKERWRGKWRLPLSWQAAKKWPLSRPPNVFSATRVRKILISSFGTKNKNVPKNTPEIYF